MKIYRISQDVVNNSEEEFDSTAYDLLEENNWKQKNYAFYYPKPPYVIDTDTPLDQFELTLGKDFIAIEDTMQEAMQAASDHYNGYIESQKAKEVTPYDKIERLYGYTDDFNRAGYIMGNGNLVNLNRPHIDHRAVTMDGTSESMQKFIAEGNIRIGFTNGYLFIDIKAQPTGSQYSQLNKLFGMVTDGISMDLSRGLGEATGSGYYDEIGRENFRTEGSLDVSSVIGVIRSYYRGRKPSEISQFR